MAAMPYVTSEDGAKSRDLTRGGIAQALVASAWFALVAAAIVLAGQITAGRASALAGALVVVTVLTGWRYWVRVRGITGDFLGATEQLCELAAFAVLAWGL